MQSGGVDGRGRAADENASLHGTLPCNAPIDTGFLAPDRLGASRRVLPVHGDPDRLRLRMAMWRGGKHGAVAVPRYYNWGARAIGEQ